ncbi:MULTISPECIES: hypothetical protein [Pseudomonas]|uniref:hypothetical protein n=1 Tax=Pseudomonas TaxID=286 RepID=UPI0015A8F276|nr:MULTISPECIES: hypothetical protein [Pseudomonas]
MQSPDQNVERNRQLLLDRSLTGLKKYGVTTERGDLSLNEWLQHLLEELLDAANYVQAAMNNAQPPSTNLYSCPETNSPPCIIGIAPTHLNVALELRNERLRQVNAEGWPPEHDDEHASDEIAAFAALYALPEACRDWDARSTGYGNTLAEAITPKGWQPKLGDRRRELIKAGALIIAEIERLDRAAQRDGGDM